MRTSRRRTLMARIGAVTAVTAAAFATAAPNASANGTDGWYKLCSQGTYQSFVKYPDPDGSGPATGRSSALARPGQCVPIYLDGRPMEVYVAWDAGGWTKIGSSAWYQADIATKGYKANPYWEYV